VRSRVLFAAKKYVGTVITVLAGDLSDVPVQRSAALRSAVQRGTARLGAARLGAARLGTAWRGTAPVGTAADRSTSCDAMLRCVRAVVSRASAREHLANVSDTKNRRAALQPSNQTAANDNSVAAGRCCLT
jgi:hypothetical protein